jgi:hypothetical protein
MCVKRPKTTKQQNNKTTKQQNDKTTKIIFNINMILNQKTTIYTVFTTAIFFSITCEENTTFLGARFFTVRLPVATLLDFFLDL